MKKIVIANWKMNKNKAEINAWLERFQILTKELDLSQIIIGIAPSFPYLCNINTCGLNIETVSQDVSEYIEGAFTGQVGAKQIKDYCKYSIVGHSETKPSYDITFSKALMCMKEGITPIVCLSNLTSIPNMPEYMFNAVIALEDLHDISSEGVYKEIDIKRIEERVLQFTDKFGSDFLGLIYGGSVNRQNALSLGKIVGLNGLLVGNASLDPDHFVEIVRNFAQV